VTKGDSFAQALPTRRTSRALRLDPAGLTTEHWFDHRTAPVEGAAFYVAHDLVARDEREAHDVVEVTGAAAVQSGEVRAADTGEPRSDPYPVGTRHFELLQLDELERANADALARADED